MSRLAPALVGALVFLGAYAGGEALARAAGERATAPTAELVVRLLAARGVPAARQGSVVTSPRGFAYRVAPACLGVGLALAAGAALAIGRRAERGRSWPALAAAAGILAANLARLVALFELGVAAPHRFAAFHRLLGPTVLLALLAAFLLAGRRWRPGVEPRPAGAP